MDPVAQSGYKGTRLGKVLRGAMKALEKEEAKAKRQDDRGGNSSDDDDEDDSLDDEPDLISAAHENVDQALVDQALDESEALPTSIRAMLKERRRATKKASLVE